MRQTRPTHILALVTAAAVAASWVVIAADRVAPMYDELHMSHAALLLARGLNGFDSAMFDAFRTSLRGLFYPPLLHIAALPITLVHPSFSAGAAAVALFAVVMAFSVYRLGTEMRDEATGLVAALLTLAMPGLAGYSRVYLVDFPFAAATAATIACAVSSDRFTRRPWCVATGLAAGAALLFKQTFILYAGPALAAYAVASLARVPSPSERRRRAVNLVLAALFCVAVALWWYAPHLLDMARRQSTINALARTLEPARVRAWDFVRLIVFSGAGAPAALVGALGIAALPRDRHGALLAAWLLAPLFLMPLVLVIETPRYVLPLLPALALTATLLLRRLPARWFRVAATVAVVAQLVWLGRAIALTPGPDISDDERHARFQEYGLLRPQRADQGYRAIADAIDPNGRDGLLILVDRPVAHSVTASLWERSPLFPVDNLFEQASIGMMPAWNDEPHELDATIGRARWVLTGRAPGLDEAATAQAPSVPPAFTAMAFAAWERARPAFTRVVDVQASGLALTLWKRE